MTKKEELLLLQQENARLRKTNDWLAEKVVRYAGLGYIQEDQYVLPPDKYGYPICNDKHEAVASWKQAALDATAAAEEGK